MHDAPDLLVARVIAVTGIDVELSTSGAGTQNLEALLEQARTFSASGGGSGLGPFLAYLGVARRYGAAFDVPAPVGTGGVALLTVHKAKGLEWPVVYVPQVSEGVFPNRRTRSTPLTSPAVLPYPLRGDAADFPAVQTWQGNQGIAAFRREVSDRERAEDRRLAYVALTRAADPVPRGGGRLLSWRGRRRRPVGAPSRRRRDEPGAGRGPLRGLAGVG
jgi:DNA helicase-2/ATP-dependent DNA helicase PcrA